MSKNFDNVYIELRKRMSSVGDWIVPYYQVKFDFAHTTYEIPILPLAAESLITQGIECREIKDMPDHSDDYRKADPKTRDLLPYTRSKK